MIRAFFLALGIFICLLGAQCLFIEKAVFANPAQQKNGPLAVNSVRATREIEPPDWAPWGLLAGGVVVILYSFTIPRRVSG
jgi:hypothetical protein